MADYAKALAAFRESVREGHPDWNMLRAGVNLLAAIDAQEPIGYVFPGDVERAKLDDVWFPIQPTKHDDYREPVFYAPPAPPAQPVAVDADNVTPLRQPRLDLARLADAISAAVYDNAKGLSVTEAIGALELAKLELLKEQEQ